MSCAVWINNPTVGSIPVQQASVTSASFTPTIDLRIGSFALWVRSVNATGEKSAWSPRYDFRITTPAALRLIDRFQLTMRPTLTWNPLAGAVKYDLWIDNRHTGESQYARESNLTTTSWTPFLDLPTGHYRAWVRGIDVSGTAARGSSFAEFRVATPPVVTSPLNSTFNRRPTFAWSAVTSATRYEVAIGANNVRCSWCLEQAGQFRDRGSRIDGFRFVRTNVVRC